MRNEAGDVKTKRWVRAYAILLVVTAATVGSFMGVRAVREANIPTVQAVTLSRQTVTETALCTGTVATAGGVEVFASVPCVAGDVRVAVGDRVNAGDVLVTVDRASTLAMAVSAGVSGAQQSAAAALLPEVITAPCAGVVSAVGASKGETLSATAPCVVLSENDGIVIDAVVRENVLSRVAVGQTVTVSGVAFDKKTYRGQITSLASSARTRVSGTTTETVVDAVVTLDEGECDPSLLIGLTAKVTVVVAEHEDVLLLPYDCLMQRDDGQAMVYCLKGDTAVACAVTVGREYAEGVEVLGGLDEQAVVVCQPEQFDGAAVRVCAEVTT